MGYFGYTGRILNVDLTRGSVTVEQLPSDWTYSLIGGMGLSGRLMYDLLKPGTDPLSPENAIVMAAGPFVGTSVPGSSRWTALTKEPLGGVVAPSSGSMKFGNKMKRAGYDCILITGKANNPSYLKIIDDDVTVCDASDLWGQDLLAATEQLEHRYPDCSVVAIGQAGENLVKFALALVDRFSNLGRGGLGAVLGSKNLKALVVGGKGRATASQPERLQTITDSLRDRMQNWPHFKVVTHYGSMENWSGYVRQSFQKSDWSEIWSPEELTEKYGPQMFDQVTKQKRACPSCPVGCKDILEIREGEYKGLVAHKSAYLNSVVAGTRLNISDYRQSLKLADELDRYGLCYFSFSSMIGFLFHLRELGIISEADVDGLPLNSDFQSAMTWVGKIGLREGFGDVAADGWDALTSNIGKGCEKYLNISKGKDLQWEPRIAGLGSMEFEQIVSIRGPASSSGGSPTYILDMPEEKLRRNIERMGVPREALDRIFSGPVQPHAGRLSRYAEDFFVVMTSLGICMRPFINRFYTLDQLAEIYSLVTGVELTGKELIANGERGWNMLKALNVREGFDRKEDKIPERWFEPMKSPDGKEAFMTDYYRRKVLTKEDLTGMLDGYYEEREWDIKRGIPTREKLGRLGLNDIADDLQRQGLIP